MSHSVEYRIDTARLFNDCSNICEQIDSRIGELEVLLARIDQFNDGNSGLQVDEFVFSIQRQIDEWRSESGNILFSVESLVDNSKFNLHFRDDAYDLKRRVNAGVASSKAKVRAFIEQLKSNRRERKEAEWKARNEAMLKQRETLRLQREELWREEQKQRKRRADEAKKRQAEREEAARVKREALAALIEKQKEELRIENQKAEAERMERAQRAKQVREEFVKLIERRKEEAAKQELANKPWLAVEDPVLSQFAHTAFSVNSNLSGDALLAEASRLRDIAMEQIRKEEVAKEKARLRLEMKEAKVSDNDIEKSLIIDDNQSSSEQLEQLYEKSSNAILDENRRRESLKIIRKAILQRGFIVNPDNIRKNGDTVTLVAQKAGGEVAKFTINLDGKFIYDFDGYDGQACQNDIKPFLDDLESVYGIHLLDRREIRKNPDKILSQKRQVKNINHDKR